MECPICEGDFDLQSGHLCADCGDLVCPNCSEIEDSSIPNSGNTYCQKCYDKLS
ncbi:FYVE zinc finger domain-containing protein [Chitinispirillales bacterium ANBcel5]|uniref:FYVE zinc finger domain-containing protein n=1 Tax=Cellulosispirillum alkaliphilum TaxID=3039283 RepID=UPI002A54636A|nr:FYVE zinc finger domain-containing protein [Chitinispirillales bacterium ANBcel5]